MSCMWHRTCYCRPMTPPTRPKASPKPRKPARPASGAVTGLRIPADVIEALDAWADRLNAAPDVIAKVTRNALVVRILRDAITRETAK